MRSHHMDRDTPAAAPARPAFPAGSLPRAVPPPGPLGAGPGAPAAPSSYAPPQYPPADADPFDFGHIDDEPPRRRAGLVVAIVVVGLLVVVAIGFAARALFTGHDSSGSPGAAATTSQSPTSGASDSASAAPSSAGPSSSSPTPRPGAAPVIAGITSIDPGGVDGEHEENVAKAIDGDPATYWYTMTYKRDDFAGFKTAVGLQLTLEEPATVSTVTLHANLEGGRVEVRASDSRDPNEGTVLASGAMSADTVLTLDPATTGSSFTIWITQLPPTPDGQFRAEISEITLG